MKPLDWIYRLSRWILGAVFIVAGGSKLLEPVIFATLIDAYGIVPDPLLMPVAIGMPAIEVIAGIGLIFDLKGSLSVIAVLLVLFMAILGYGIQMGLDVDCGCFGPGDPEAKAFHGLRTALGRDLLMMLGIAFVAGWRRYRRIEPVWITQVINGNGSKRRRADNAYV